jgi:quercetin dioxygenase-like cupin family protein
MNEVVRTAPRADREVAGPAVTFTISDEMDMLTREPEWLSGDRNAVTVLKTPNLSVVLTVIKKGAKLCGHEVDGPITIQVLSGAVRFGLAADSKTLRDGTVIALDKAVPHEIEALENSGLMLTIVREVK